MKFTNMSKYIIIPVEEIEAKITDYRKQHKNYLATLITILEKLLNSHKQISLDEKDRGNLLKARNWLVNNEPEFNKDKFWRECCDWEIFQGNDTWCTMPSEEHCDDKEQLKLFAKHFPTKDVLWFVSW